MGFKAENSNINTILSRNFSYIIPLNQRKYVWDEREWNELFEDLFLIEQRDDYSHFLGSLVFSKVKGKNQYEIIDGQQRLITLSIILCCIVNQLHKCDEGKVAISIVNPYLRGVEDGDDYFKISRRDGNFFLSQIISKLEIYITQEDLIKEFEDNFSKNDKYNEKFLLCYKYFEDRIVDFIQQRKKKNKETLLYLKKKLIDGEVIEITVTDEMDGFRIFETLNARGIPLEQHELIKNYIYSYMRTNGKQQKVTNSWNKITENLTKEKTDVMAQFISHYCTHAYGNVKKNEEFKTIRNETKKTEVELLLSTLVENSEYYKYIIEPLSYKNSNGYSAKVYDTLCFFKDMNIRQVRPLIMSIFEAYRREVYNQKELESILYFLESFYFVYVIVGKNTTNFIDNTIVSLSKKIHAFKEKVYLSSIKQEFSAYYPNYDDSLSSFMQIGFSNKNKKYKNSANKKAVNYILKRIEESYDETKELAGIKITSIEHILPDQNNNDSVCKLGNLLPMGAKSNSKAGNSAFSEKLKRYKKSNLISMKKFIEHYGNNLDWNVFDIENRTKKICEYSLKKIWDIWN